MNKPPSTQSHHLFEVKTDNKPIAGLLVKMVLNEDLISRIKPHEKFDPKKVSSLFDVFFSGEKQILPIILGTLDSSDYLLKIENVSQIKKLNPLIIVDGHHRYEAFKQLYESGIETSILAWITSVRDLTISSFIKVCSYENPKFLESVIKKYSINPKKNLYCSKETYEVNLFYLGEYFTIQFPSIELLLKEINIFENFFEQGKMNLIKLIDQDNHVNNSLQEINSKYLYFSHSSFEYEHLLTMLTKNECLPRHSTCFKPKPNSKLCYEKISNSLIKIY